MTSLQLIEMYKSRIHDPVSGLSDYGLLRALSPKELAGWFLAFPNSYSIPAAMAMVLVYRGAAAHNRQRKHLDCVYIELLAASKAEENKPERPLQSIKTSCIVQSGQ